MEHCYANSTPNYFTPKKRARTAEKFYTDKAEKSTAQKYYDLQDSFKQYEQLLEENLQLKGLLLKQNFVQKTSLKKQPIQRQTQERSQMNDTFQNNKKWQRNFSSKCLSTNTACQSSSAGYDPTSPHNTRPAIKEDDVAMWSIKHRNNYLQEKLSNLKGQYSRQTHMIQKVVNSDKWRNRFDCKEATCYQDKYLKLLRVRSPVLLE